MPPTVAASVVQGIAMVKKKERATLKTAINTLRGHLPKPPILRFDTMRPSSDFTNES